MEELRGLATVLNALGEKIAMLEDDLRYERICRENAEKETKRLRDENCVLRGEAMVETRRDDLSQFPS